jgi:hypothetical protein
MGYNTTWLYKHGVLEEDSSLNGCIVAFNPRNSVLLNHQVEALAKETGFDFHIYENYRTEVQLLTAAQLAFDEGYEKLLVLTSVETLTETERLIKSYYTFNEVQALAESVPTPIPVTEPARARADKELLREAGPVVAPALTSKPVAPAAAPALAAAPVGTVLLIVGALHANPPVKGHAQMIQEVLDQAKNAEALVKTYLPKFYPMWVKGGKQVQTRIFLRRPESGSTNPLAAGTRINLLADGDGYAGLYDNQGVSPSRVNPPLTSTYETFIPGNYSVSAVKQIQDFTAQLPIGGVIGLSPASQIQNVTKLFNSSVAFNQADGGRVPVLKMNSSDVDQCDTQLVATAVQIGNDCFNQTIVAAAKKEELADPNKKDESPVFKGVLENADYFTMQLIVALHQFSGPNGDKMRNQVLTTKDRPNKGIAEYFKGIWDAIPEGDRILLKDIGTGTGIGDVVSVVKNIAKLGNAIASGGGGGGKKSQNEIEREKKWKEAIERLGYDPIKMVMHPSYKAVKAKIDV